MKKRASVEDMLATILNGHRQLADQFSISDINQLNDFLEDNEYMDDVLEIEQSLSDWILFLIMMNFVFIMHVLISQNKTSIY